MFLKIDIPKNFATFQEIMCWSNRLQAYNFIKKYFQHKFFLVKNICERLLLKFNESDFDHNIILSLLWKTYFRFLSLSDCTNTVAIRLTTSWLHFYFSGYLIIYWWEHTPYVVVVANFFSVSDQRPDLAVQDFRDFFVEKFSDPRPVNIVFW